MPQRQYLHHIVYISFLDGSDKFYVGKHSTNNLDDGYCGSGRWVKNCLKAGKTFKTMIVWEFSDEDIAYEYEKILVDKMMKRYQGRCMNFRRGGRGNKSGSIGSEETKRKMSLARKGKKLSGWHCERISHGRMGIVFSEPHKARLSLAKSLPVRCNKTGLVFPSTTMAAKHYGVTRTWVSHICSGLRSSRFLSFSYVKQEGEKVQNKNSIHEQK